MENQSRYCDNCPDRDTCPDYAQLELNRTFAALTQAERAKDLVSDPEFHARFKANPLVRDPLANLIQRHGILPVVALAAMIIGAAIQEATHEPQPRALPDATDFPDRER